VQGELTKKARRENEIQSTNKYLRFGAKITLFICRVLMKSPEIRAITNQHHRKIFVPFNISLTQEQYAIIAL
jgi:hypothetical protein